MDAKNKLQEYFQQSKLSLPVYKTTRAGGQDHAPLWVSSVFCHNGTSIEGEVFNSKSDAEKSAAQKALHHLQSTLHALKEAKDYPLKTAIIIDMENMPKFFDTIPEEDLNHENLTVYGFIGVHHPMMDKMVHPKFVQVQSPSTRKDGTDTCIQVTVGHWLAEEKYDNYLIVTRDHFGSCLVDMITADNMMWKKKEAKHITKYEDCHIVTKRVEVARAHVNKNNDCFSGHKLYQYDLVKIEEKLIIDDDDDF